MRFVQHTIAVRRTSGQWEAEIADVCATGGEPSRDDAIRSAQHLALLVLAESVLRGAVPIEGVRFVVVEEG